MFAGGGARVVGRKLMREQRQSAGFLSDQTHSANIKSLHKDPEEKGFVSAVCANMHLQTIHLAVANNLDGYFKKSP